MNIYIVERTDKINWDEMKGFVIVASTPDDARAIANAAAKDEGKIWGDVERVTCKIVDPKTAGIVLESFNAG